MPGPVRSEFYTFSPVRSVWSGPKNIPNPINLLGMYDHYNTFYNVKESIITALHYPLLQAFYNMLHLNM